MRGKEYKMESVIMLLSGAPNSLFKITDYKEHFGPEKDKTWARREKSQITSLTCRSLEMQG